MVKPKHKIELHKQFKVPIDGLMAEEVNIHKQDNNAKKNQGKPYEVVEEIESEGEDKNDAEG